MKTFKVANKEKGDIKKEKKMNPY